jgi:O-antigen/teichoic acid export membrane protein
MIKTIFKSTLIGFLTKGVGFLGSLIIIPLMLRRLGATHYGIWVTITSTISMLGFMDFGIGNRLMGFIANHNHDKKLVKGHVILSYLLQFIIIIIASVILVVLFHFTNWESWFHIVNPGKDILSYITVVFIFFMLGFITNTIYAIQRGMQRSDIANTWQLISSICSIIFLFFVLRNNYPLYLIAFGTFGIPVFVALINTIWFLRKHQLFEVTFDDLKIKDAFHLFKGGIVMLYLQIAAVLAFQTDTLILAHYLTFEDVSKFNIIARVFAIPAIATQIYFQSLWPAYSDALIKNNWNWIRNTFIYSCLITSIVIFAFCLLAYCNNDFIFQTWLKTNWKISLDVFLAFSIWTLISNIDNNIAIVLNGLQLFRIQIVLSVFMVTSNIVLSVVWVMMYGMEGVIWGSAISTFVFSAVPFLIYLRKLFRSKVSLI